MDIRNMDVVIGVYERTLYDPSQPWDKPLGWIETEFGIRRLNVMYALVIYFAFYLIYGNDAGAGVISNGIGFVYPAYVTIDLLIQTQQRSSSVTAINKWFTYWMTFAAILIVEQQFIFVLKLPYYYLIKSLFMIFCFIPMKNNGAAFTHRNIIRPYFGDYYATE